jgi:hypothetical protein
MLAIVEEARIKAIAIREMFPTNTRGMMVFWVAMSIFAAEYPGLFRRMDDAPEMLAQWVQAGQPESLKDIPEAILARIINEEFADGVQMPKVQ